MEQNNNGKAKKRGLQSPKPGMLIEIVKLRPTKGWRLIGVGNLRERRVGATGTLHSPFPGHKGVWFVRQDGAKERVVYDVREMEQVLNN